MARLDSLEIRRLVPHSGSMCLLERVIAWDENSVLCASETHRDFANPLRREGKLSAVHALEYAAQAIAVHGGLRARAAGKSAPPGYLAALRDATLHAQRLDDLAGPLTVRAQRLFADQANSVYDCHVSAGDQPVAEARITIILRVPADLNQVAPGSNLRRRQVENLPHPKSETRRVIPADHPSLPGHFPGEPIIPGVVILEEICAAISEWRGADCRIRAIPIVKFLAPVKPCERFSIQLTPDISNDLQVSFRCLAADGTVAEGRLIISCP